MNNEDQSWLDYRNRFADVYHGTNYSSPLQSFVMRAGHSLTEKYFNKNRHFSRVVEIGVGPGEHLPFVRHSFDHYVLTDLDPRVLEVARKSLIGLHDGKLSFEVQSGSKLNYDNDSIDRLVATHVLEHINEPHLALKEWRRVVKSGGILSILIPTDPGIVWRLGRCFGPRKKTIAQGIDYDYVMAREHVNSCNNLIALIRHYFPERREAWWPLSIPSIDLNLFFVCHALVSKK
jgi:phosphatidylethanolamine/phosphatidyl-N-methylethanolamine N-methyltransferase